LNIQHFIKPAWYVQAGSVTVFYDGPGVLFGIRDPTVIGKSKIQAIAVIGGMGSR